jgi:alcohol dehydrogenase class IV
MSRSFEFATSRSILVSRGAVGDELTARMATLECRRPMIITDAGVIKAGLLSNTLSMFARASVETVVFSEVVADPSDAVILQAVEQARRAKADLVIGFGGGSSMDAAKLVALLAGSDERLETVYGVGMVKGKRLPLFLVPTTSGTGSEVTPIAIVTTGTGEKKGVVSATLLPDLAILDATLTVGLPTHVTAATGIDAMVHATEAYTSKRLKNPISDCLAREAMRLLSQNIHQVCRQGDNLTARENMLIGACLAGMAFANAPVAAVHALAYPVGARFHVPHGLSNALVLAPVLRFNIPLACAQYAELGRIIGAPPEADDAEAADWFVATLGRLAPELGLETRLSQLGIDATNLPDLAADAMKQTRLLVNNPRELTYDDALAIYSEVL